MRSALPASAPLSADRYQVRFTASAATIAKLRHARHLLSHAVSSGDVGEIFDRALDVLLREAEKRRFAATTKPRSARRIKEGSRDIPARVRRTVWRRDGGQCAFVGSNGHRCTERSFLEFHHPQPYDHQGPATVEKGAYFNDNVRGRFRYQRLA